MLTESHLARALVVLAEALVAERRVVVVGDSSLGLNELLADLGARLVHVYDPDGERAASQAAPGARGTVVRALPEGDFDVRDGAFDLAIVPDVGAVEDAAALLARLRRVVGASGAVLCASPNREGDALDYYALYDLVALQFSNVRMIAAMPFAGVTMAELGQDEVEAAVRVDTQLAGDRPSPSAYVALASQSDVAVDAYAVIELPGDEEEPAAKSIDHAALAQARLRADVLQSQVQELAETRSARARAEEEARRALEALEIERQRVLRLERDLDEIASARAKAPEPAAPKNDLAEQLAEAQIRAAALEEGVELAEKTIVSQRDRIAELEGRLADAEEAEALRSPEPTPSDIEDEIASLEGKLRERGEKILELESEIARLQKVARELVARLEPAEPNGEGQGDLAQKLDDLAVLAARQKSELEARAWRIAELERTVSEHAEPHA